MDSRENVVVVVSNHALEQIARFPRVNANLLEKKSKFVLLQMARIQRIARNQRNSRLSEELQKEDQHASKSKICQRDGLVKEKISQRCSNASTISRREANSFLRRFNANSNLLLVPNVNSVF